MDDAQTIMLSVLDDLKSKPFTDEEVNRSKVQFANFELLMNDSENAARNLSEWQSMGDWRLLFLYRDRIQKVTRDPGGNRRPRNILSPQTARSASSYPEKNAVRAEIPPPPDVNALAEKR